MTISSNHIYYPSTMDSVTGALTAQTTTWYDLRTAAAAFDGTDIGSTATVYVRFRGLPSDAPVRLPKTQFETAKATSLANGG